MKINESAGVCHSPTVHVHGAGYGPSLASAISHNHSNPMITVPSDVLKSVSLISKSKYSGFCRFSSFGLAMRPVLKLLDAIKMPHKPANCP